MFLELSRRQGQAQSSETGEGPAKSEEGPKLGCRSVEDGETWPQFREYAGDTPMTTKVMGWSEGGVHPGLKGKGLQTEAGQAEHGTQPHQLCDLSIASVTPNKG